MSTHCPRVGSFLSSSTDSQLLLDLALELAQVLTGHVHPVLLGRELGGQRDVLHAGLPAPVREGLGGRGPSAPAQAQGPDQGVTASRWTSSGKTRHVGSGCSSDRKARGCRTRPAATAPAPSI